MSAILKIYACAVCCPSTCRLKLRPDLSDHWIDSPPSTVVLCRGDKRVRLSLDDLEVRRGRVHWTFTG